MPIFLSVRTNFFGVADPVLDAQISSEVLMNSIHSSKGGSAPGPDMIPFECFKALPANWYNYLLNLLNTVWAHETFPINWGLIKLIPIFKKGDPTVPTNYRGIALVNCITKIFTKILCTRLSTWAESNRILPDEQFGFRAGRSCVDAVFLLNSAINIQLRAPNSQVWVIFVDFMKAFDSVSHQLLYLKLLRCGVSPKFIRVIKKIYDVAKVFICQQNAQSEDINVNRGVLQGEKLSPLLFSLFVYDVLDFFRLRGASGICLDGDKDLLMVLYADDQNIVK